MRKLVRRAHGWLPRYQFSVRALLAFTAKCACLLAVLRFVDDTLAVAVALPVLVVWMPFELAVSRRCDPRVPRAVAALFLLARMLFVYGCSLVVLAATIFLISLTWTKPVPFSQALAAGMLMVVCVGASMLASLASCILAAVAWRWDRRARWLVYVSGGYVAAMLAFLGVIELLIWLQL
ncbi:MAG TPA: hypothetical protein VF278_24200 [Pirellulales bacterium]